jgi:hypothetical protein
MGLGIAAKDRLITKVERSNKFLGGIAGHGNNVSQLAGLETSIEAFSRLASSVKHEIRLYKVLENVKGKGLGMIYLSESFSESFSCTFNFSADLAWVGAPSFGISFGLSISFTGADLAWVGAPCFTLLLGANLTWVGAPWAGHSIGGALDLHA